MHTEMSSSSSQSQPSSCCQSRTSCGILPSCSSTLAMYPSRDTNCRLACSESPTH